MAKVNCQNCGQHLGTKSKEDTFIYSPSQCDSLSQGLDPDSTLVTLQCPKCDCLVQIKT